MTSRRPRVARADEAMFAAPRDVAAVMKADSLLRLPPGATDTHVHVLDPLKFPFASDRRTLLATTAARWFGFA